MRVSHTTTGNKAKCLSYLCGGSRCGRVAKMLVVYNRPSGRGPIRSEQPMCAECARIACEQHDGQIVEDWEAGATVGFVGIGLGQQRVYREVK